MHDVLMREGLVRSLNVVTVDLAMRTGLNTVSNFVGEFGLPRPAPYPALALGTTEATPLQMAAAYAAFANGGDSVVPTVIRRVIDTNSGETLIEERPKTNEVIKPTTAYMITDMLSDVIKRGTAQRAKGVFKNVAIAGKTGTSRDGWFVGYTPNLVCAVWIGFDDNEQLGLTGAEAALPAWIDFMKEALAIRPSLGGSNFTRPSGITTVKVDPETGWLAGPNCPSAVTVSVSYSFAPSVECLKHMPPEPEIYEASFDPTLGENTTEILTTEDQSSTSSSDESLKGDDSEVPSETEQQDSNQVRRTPAASRRTEKVITRDGRLILMTAPTVYSPSSQKSKGASPE
jgi:membrane carboxypeptidase/penicillin-binding protein